MPDVGSLFIKIESDAGTAAGSLGKLATSLGNVKKNSDVNLGNVQTQIANLVGSVKGGEKAATSLGTLFNSISGYYKTFKGITEKFELNTKPIEQIQEAVKGGIKIGNAGSQLSQFRQALEGNWNMKGAEAAATALESIGSKLNNVDGEKLNTTATGISALAGALNEFASATEAVKSAVGGGSDVSTAVPQFESLGKDSATGYAQGIKEDADLAKEASRDMVLGGLDEGAKAQASNSPSKEYAKLGSYGAEGYIEGFKSKATEAASNIADFVRGLLEVASAETSAVSGQIASTAIRSAFSNLLQGSGLSDAQQKIVQSGVEIAADFTSSVANNAKGNFGQIANITSDFVKTVMTNAISEATKAANETISIDPDKLLPNANEVNANLQHTETTIQSANEAQSDFLVTSEQITKQTQMTNEELEEARRIRQQMNAEADQQRLENNYPMYRELFMSGEGGWEKQVPEMYGLDPEAIKECETYADAFARTLQIIDEWVNRVDNDMDGLQKPLLRDQIDNMLGINREPLSAQSSASALKNVTDVVDTSSVVHGMQEVQSTTQTMTSSMDSAKTTTRVLADNMRDLDGELKEKKSDMVGVTEGAESVKRSFTEIMFGANGLKGSFKRLFPTISSLLTRFKNIAKYRALRYVLRSITSGITEGTKNLYFYSDSIKGSFATSMDSAASSLLQMKNSIGAAIAPAIEALIPYLQTVVNWFITLVNYVNQFFALLNGQATWTKAVLTSTKAYTDSTKKASSATKDLLADWDELNIIQSNSSSGTGSGSDTDYSKMFEEVSEYSSVIEELVDGIKETFGDIWTLAKKIAVVLLGWKLSNAFAGLIGTLGALVAAGEVMVISWQLTEMFDSKYVDTGDEGWLVADALTNLVGATLAGTIVGKVLGGAAGIITAGVEMIVSGGISYGIGLANKDKDEGQALMDFGAIKGIIGDAAIAVGFGVATGSVGAAIAAAVAAAPLFFIAAGISVVAAQIESAKEVAEKAFTAKHEGAISVEELYNELQTKFNEASKGYSIVMNAFSNVPTLKTDLSEAYEKIVNLTSVITGDGKLTQDEAEEFKKAWTTIFDSFKGITEDSFNTAFDALNISLSSENEEIRAQAKELRTSLLMIQENITEAEAKMKNEMDELASKITAGTATSDEKNRYLQYVENLAKYQSKAFQELQDTVNSAGNVDFSNWEEVSATLTKIGEDEQAAMKEIEEGSKSGTDAIDSLLKTMEFLNSMGLYDGDYEADKKVWETAKQNILDEAENRGKTVVETAQQGYKIMLEAAMKNIKDIPLEDDGDVNIIAAAEYVMHYVEPLVAAIKEAGGEVDQELAEALQLGTDPEEVLKQFLEGLWKGTVDLPLYNYLLKYLKIPVTLDPELANTDLYKDIMNAVKDDKFLSNNEIQEIKNKFGEKAYMAGIRRIKEDIEQRGITFTVAPMEDVPELINTKAEEELRDAITNDLNLSQSEITEMIKKYGEAEYYAALRDVKEYLEGQGVNFNIESNDTSGSIKPDAVIASSSSMSLGGRAQNFVSNGDYTNGATNNGSVVMTESANPEQDANSIRNGTSSLASTLSSILMLVEKLNNKEWTINVNPSSGWGFHNQQSNNARQKVTG